MHSLIATVASRCAPQPKLLPKGLSKKRQQYTFCEYTYTKRATRFPTDADGAPRFYEYEEVKAIAESMNLKPPSMSGHLRHLNGLNDHDAFEAGRVCFNDTIDFAPTNEADSDQFAKLYATHLDMKYVYGDALQVGHSLIGIPRRYTCRFSDFRSGVKSELALRDAIQQNGWIFVSSFIKMDHTNCKRTNVGL